MKRKKGKYTATHFNVLSLLFIQHLVAYVWHDDDPTVIHNRQYVSDYVDCTNSVCEKCSKEQNQSTPSGFKSGHGEGKEAECVPQTFGLHHSNLYFCEAKLYCLG